MANFFSSIFGSSPTIQTQTTTDPLKQSVANPLSSYLTSQVGQGLPSYTGQLVAPLPQGGGASVAPFLNLTAQDLINQTNTAATNQFKSTFADITEQSAGGLSSSSRAYNADTATTQLELGLASQDTAIQESLPAAQTQVAQTIANQQTAADQASYQNWWNSLAQNNPALGQAMQFLSNSTSSGTTVLSALNPGTQSLLPSLIGAAGTVGGSIISNQGISALTAALLA